MFASIFAYRVIVDGVWATV